MNIVVRVATSFCLLVMTTAAAVASQDPPRPDKLPPASSERTGLPSIVFEKQHLRVRIESDGRSTRTMTILVRANDDAGVRQAAQIPLTYMPSSEDLELVSLAVHKPDGRTIPVGPEAIHEHTIQPAAQIPMFVDLRQKTVTVPALQPGDMIAITVMWKLVRPLAARHAWFEHSFVKHAVVTDERLELDIPADLHAVIRPGPAAPAERNGGAGQVDGNRRLYVWQTSNPKVASENDVVADEAPVPDLRVTTFRDWTAFAAWMAPLMRPESDDSVREKALALTKGLTEPSAKIEALYHYVSTEIRYVSLSIGLNRFAAHSPGEVLKNQYGDCKDKHALLSAMLETIGVRAVPILVNTGRSISEDLPAPTEFDHVLTAIPSGDDPARWAWLDTTLEIAPRGLLAAETRGRLALALGHDGRPPRIVTTPDGGPFPFVDATTIKAKINPLGLLTAQVRLTARGDSELVLRGSLRIMPRESLKEFGEGFAKAIGFDGEISDFAFSDPLATRDPFEISFSIRKAGYLDWAATESAIAVPTGRLLTSGLDPDQTPLKADRKMKTSASLRRLLTLELPPGYSAVAPVGVRAAKDDFVYASRYEVDGRVIRVERTLEGYPRKLLVAHAADYSRIARSINADHDQTFKLSRLDKSVAQVPDDMTARELYSAGYSAFTAKNYETSIAIWNRAAALDPKMTSVLNGLGLAYQRLKRYDEAIAALEKQRTLEPTNNKVNADLGFVYEEAGRLEDAAAAYTRYVAGAPLDGDSHQELGEIYADLNRHAEAVAAFERAIPLVKNDPWLYREFGRSLLALGRRADAIAAFETALKQKRTPAIESAIAWTLADHGIEPARVLDLAASTVTAVADTMKSADAQRLDADHFDLMERLAWAWDARGLVEFRKGEVDQAIISFESAWKLGAASETALHLAQAYEKKDRRADAINYYLTARALDNSPGPALQDALKRNASNIDIERFLKPALMNIGLERTVIVEGNAVPGREASFNGLLDGKGRVVDVAFLDGDKELVTMGAIRALQFRDIPAASEGMRLAVRIRVACDEKSCYANLQVPRDVKE